MTAVPALKPEMPTVCITCHEDYRYARQRIGEIEDAKPDTLEELERAALKTAILAYEGREASPTG